jgi:Integrase zinc binding domain
MINGLFDQYHNAPMDGHYNGLRTYEMLRISYYWPKMGQQYLPDAILVTLANRLDYGSRTIVDI